ncbi:MAG: hypothetical protein M1575_01125 [Patescibacteria group bacterium]|nr:hypothetical protein [Patescibacteria group bacterium]MCL5095321.1 hypothetical protein [Patescibacteria group bacterium]
MNIKKTVPLAALALVLLGGGAFGISRVKAAPVHAQTPTIQSQSATQQTADKETNDGATEVKEAREGVESVEPANEQAQEKNLPGGGHQDQGQADHQFEGVE